MMGNVALVLFTVLLLQLCLAAAWGVGIWALGMPRRPARHWMLSALACAMALALVLLRPHLPPALGISLSNLLMVATAVFLLHGMRLFLGLALRDRETVAVLLLYLLCSGLALPRIDQPSGLGLQGAATTLALLWLLVRATTSAFRALRAEFGTRSAVVLVAPMGLTLLMDMLRLASLVATPARGLQVDTPLHVAVVLVLLLAMLMMHGAMAAMVVMRLLARLRELSQRDPLTGLLNRGEWLRQLRAQHRWLGRHGEGFAVLIIDVDHFKQVNDRWGHAAGDAALVNVAQLLLTGSRAFDAAGRLGGEEFVLLLPRTDAAAAMRLAERLRLQLAEAEIEWKHQPLRLTVSIGVGVADDADETPEQLLERIDQALYRAKHAGRDRVMFAPRPDVAGGAPPLAAHAATAAPLSRRGPSLAPREFADTA